MENREDGKDVISEIEEMLGKDAADRVKAMKHGEGVLAGDKAAYESVLKILARAVKEPHRDYLDALLLSTFPNEDQAKLFVAALDERLRYGVDITPIVALLTAKAAVVGARGGRAGLLIEGQTHQSITTNLSSALKRSFFNKNKKDDPLGLK